MALQAAVVYTPFLQQAFSTTALDGGDWVTCVVVASSMLWESELGKAVRRWKAATPAAQLEAGLRVAVVAPPV